MTVSHVLSDADAQTYLEIGITPREIVLLRWPELTDEDAIDWVLWELTEFPMVRGVHDLADAIAALNWQPEPKETTSP